jgi:signal transduction histidine kinase/DNA-binding response OmpR family regulator
MTNKQNLEEILIIEDSPTQAERLRYVLEQHGYRVSLARNGREAMDSLANHKPSLVISDILMPEADGYEVCRFVRQRQDLQNLPVILLTALSDPVDVMRALECGADNFLVKPFEEDQLLQRVQLFLLNHDLRKPEGEQASLDIVFQGQKYFINSNRLQILNLLLSTYEAAVEKNSQLLKAQTELQSQAMELEAQSEELRVRNDELRDLAEVLQKSENATQRQAQILAGINRIFHEALTDETEEKLGETCLAVAEELTGSRFGFICEVNQAGRFDTIAISNPGWAACKFLISETTRLLYDVPVRGIRSKVIETGETLLCNDPQAHPDYVVPPEGHPPITAFLGVPLNRAGKTIGMVALGNKAGGYTDADREAMEALASAIMEAFMRKRAEEALKQARDELEQRVKDRTAELWLTVAQLQEEITHRLQAEKSLKESEGRLRHLTSQILTAQEAERRRLALDLHDDLGQSMTVLKMELRAIQRKATPESSETRESLEHALNFINEIIEKIRRLSRNLRPTILEDLGLTRALNHLFEEFSRQDIQVTMDLDDIQELFSQEAQLIIYRIFQESFSNITKYAQASHVSLIIKRQDQGVTFQMEDNGRGFDHQKVINEDITKRGLGLTAMDERARMLGGSLNIWSQAGQGTKITLVIPIRVK